ncbi:hypothetical protein AU099_gp80 [Gordonia phage GTE8]|uniref:Uncharacterized protein n=1 Tax=Gordonia phage GTE8 TaxID=1647475 RepID=A0A0K0N6Q7_9CAUD|nr:hypothetical protein AU099_gp80 [Gordonia phage GTE8]AKJ72423.1 hypothetical protein GTE8_80 [Gordonia phage GTE8]
MDDQTPRHSHGGGVLSCVRLLVCACWWSAVCVHLSASRGVWGGVSIRRRSQGIARLERFAKNFTYARLDIGKCMYRESKIIISRIYLFIPPRYIYIYICIRHCNRHRGRGPI